MNKGIKISTGMWINFMNAGDTLYKNSTLMDIRFDNYSSFALLYGNHIQGNKIIYPLEIEKLKYGEIMACHQSMFFNKNILLDELVYDLKLPIYADYELVNKIYFKKLKIKYINLALSNYLDGGISSFVSTQKRKDKYKTVYKYYGFFGLIESLVYRVFGNRKQNLKDI
jgi:hypothetical protein